MAEKQFNSVAGFSVGYETPIGVIDANANVTANYLFVDNDANVTGNLTSNTITVNSYANLGNVGNVYIGGGSSGQVLSTDGLGNLSWTNGGSGTGQGLMPFYIPENTTYTVYQYQQGLFSIPITVEGVLEVDGILVQV
jgi:hypothetical protein